MGRPAPRTGAVWTEAPGFRSTGDIDGKANQGGPAPSKSEPAGVCCVMGRGSLVGVKNE